jgi:hypothetical protein
MAKNNQEVVKEITAERGPAQRFRVGSVTASIWKNDGQGGTTYYSVTLQKSFREGNEWRNTDTLNHADVVCAIKALERAEAWVAGV